MTKLFWVTGLVVFLLSKVQPTASAELEISVTSTSRSQGNQVEFKVNGNVLDIDSGRGVNMATLNQDGSMISFHRFDTHADGSEALVDFVDQLSTGTLVLVAARDDAKGNMTRAAKEALKSCGAQLIDDLLYRGSYAMIGVKNGVALDEKTFPDGTVAVASATYSDKVTFPITVISSSRSNGNHVIFQVQGQNLTVKPLRGLNVAVISPAGLLETFQVFDTHAGDSEAFEGFVQSLPSGTLVLVAVRDEAQSNMSSAAVDAMKLLGSTKIGSLVYRGSYALIGIKDGVALAEETFPDGTASVASAEYSSTVTVTYDLEVRSTSSTNGDTAFFKVDGEDFNVQARRGLNVVLFTQAGSLESFHHFDTHAADSEVTAKASVLFTTTCAFGMLISLLQSIGIIGTMTVEFPVDVKGIFSWMSIFVLELDNFGFACLAGSATPPRYMVSVLFFPLGLAWFALNYGVSQLVPKYRWDLTKTFACMGQFLQVGFSTMSAIALAPLTCYTHPNQQQSLLKYPNVICGSTDHSIMLVGGVLLLCVGVLGFLCLCSYAALKVPEWSAMEKHARVRAFRFLVFRFRLDSWWFGVPLLTRGPLIALPIVLATDYPAIQSVWVTFILLCFLACQALAWPWKVPLLNALDCWMSYCIMILVAGSALYLEPINKVGIVADFVDNFTTGVMVVIFGSIGSMVLMALCALTHRAAMGGSSEFAVFNLGRTPKPDVVAQKLKEMGELLGQMDAKDVEKAFDTLAVFDTRRITTFMTMMSAEVLMERADLSYGKRVTSQSFSGAPKPQRDSTGSIIRSTTRSTTTRSRDSKNSTQAATV